MNDADFMRGALKEARRALERGDVPVGALVVLNGEVLGTGSNRKDTDPTAHAEVQALRMAAEKLGRWNLRGCALYVTLEPCPMCAGAVINARVGRVVYGAKEPNFGSCGSVINLFEERYGHHPKLYGGVLAEECAAILKRFFERLRS